MNLYNTESTHHVSVFITPTDPTQMSALREPFDCVNFRKTLLFKIHSLSESYEGYVNMFALCMRVLVILYVCLDYRKQTLRKKKVTAQANLSLCSA